MEIKRWSRATEIRRMTAALPGASEHWAAKPYWNEFSKWRREFLSKFDISDTPTETDRSVLIQALITWVRDGMGRQWCAGTWAEYPGLADWHVNQYLRSKPKKIPPDPEVSAPNNEPSATVKSYYDPARDL